MPDLSIGMEYCGWLPALSMGIVATILDLYDIVVLIADQKVFVDAVAQLGW